MLSMRGWQRPGYAKRGIRQRKTVWSLYLGTEVLIKRADARVKPAFLGVEWQRRLAFGLRVWYNFSRGKQRNARVVAPIGFQEETMPTCFPSVEAAVRQGLIYACREDLTDHDLEEIKSRRDIRVVKGGFLTTHGSVINKTVLTLELRGCSGGKVRICVTRFRFGFGLWLIDARGVEQQA
jgi:hypothetical protein